MTRFPLLAFAAALAGASAPTLATEAALTKMGECMGLGVASPQQLNCMEVMQAYLRSAPASRPAAQMAPPKVAAEPKVAGAAAPKPAPPASAEVKRAAATLGLAGQAPTIGIGGVGAADIQGMSPEAAMKVIQARQAELIQSQLKAQMEAMQKRNEEVRKANEALPQTGARGVAAQLEEIRANVELQAKMQQQQAQMQQHQAKIDSLNRSQQTELQKMQSFMNQNKEAVGQMLNYVQKAADAQVKAIGNMRL